MNDQPTAEPLTDDQAKMIADVISTADGGCPSCVGELADEMKKRWPDRDWHTLTGLGDA